MGLGQGTWPKTKKVLQDLINEGNSAAMISYAMKVLDLQKAEIGSDNSKGITLLERAALEEKDSQAAIYLSLLFNQGNVVPRDQKKAITLHSWLDAGVIRAYGTMGQIFQNQNDMKSAVQWFQKELKGVMSFPRACSVSLLLWRVRS